MVSARIRKKVLKPDWLVIVLSTCLSGITFAIISLTYLSTDNWQHLGLAGMSAFVLAIHGIVYWVQPNRLSFKQAILAIAVVKIFCVAIAPLLVENIWPVGPLLLAIVTIEVGIGDDLRRIPLLLVLVFLGASIMILADLVAPFQRVNLFSNATMLYAAIVIMVLMALGYLFLLWLYRLRSQSPYFVSIDIVTQQSFIIALTLTLSIVVVAGVLIAQILQNQIEQVGFNFQNVAEINAERLGILISEQVDDLSFLARVEPILIDILIESNQQYPESELSQLRQDLENQWQSSSATDSFVLSIRNNDATFALSRFRGNAYLQDDLFLLDRYAGLVASQGKKPEAFFYNDEPWWEIAWNFGQGGVFVGNLDVDPVTKEAKILIAVGVINPQTNETLGVLTSTLSLFDVQQEFREANQQIDGEILLVSDNGTIIAAADNTDVGTALNQDMFDVLPAAGDVSGPDWYLGNDRFNENAVVSYSPFVTTQTLRLGILRDLGWLVVVSESQSDALADVIQSIKVATFVALIAILSGILASNYLARVITMPIHNLTMAAIEITKGNLDQKATAAGPDELQTLSRAFNTLTTQVRELVNDLQNQVEQRTQQLEARVDQLATLNRITQAVSSVHNTQNVLQSVATEMAALFNAQHCVIALLNNEQTELEIAMDYPQTDQQRSIIGAIVPLASYPSTQEIIRAKKSVIISDAASNEITRPIHDFVEQNEIKCMMIVPLVTRGDIIGEIAIGTTQVGRVFSESEVSLGETVAGQISGAIESARLYLQTQEALAFAESANEAKSTFLASVSHELRTPLTSVLGFARIIDKRLHDRIFPLVQDEDAKTQRTIQQIGDNIEIIVSEGERLTTLINNVLDLAKIEAGKVEWDMTLISIKDVAERGVMATAALFEGKDLERHLFVPENLPMVYGDFDKLVQVVVNLISNAVKFTDYGSVTVQVTHNYEDVTVRVIDTGVGIDEKNQQSVFERFKQVGDTLTDKPQGTGLGLSICKDIVEHHQGQIWVESRSGNGSVFAFTLPVRREAPRSDH